MPRPKIKLGKGNRLPLFSEARKPKKLNKLKTKAIIEARSYKDKDSVKTVNCCLFGLGKIGQQVLKNIIKNRENHLQLFNIDFKIISVFDSSGFVSHGVTQANIELNDGELLDIIEWKQKRNEPLRIYRDMGRYMTDFEVFIFFFFVFLFVFVCVCMCVCVCVCV